MSDSTQQWILRKPLKAFVENDQYDEACYAIVADDGLAWQFMDKESFDELFKPLDIPAIESDLEDIILELQNDDVATCINKILVLFGLSVEEQK